MTDLLQEIDSYFGLPTAELRADARDAFERLLEELEAGRLRAAEPVDGGWRVNASVKRGILLGFRLGRLVAYESGGALQFSDKDTYPVQHVPVHERNVRIVPGGPMPSGIPNKAKAEVRQRYIDPMVKLRQHKGLAPDMAEAMLEDNVVIGTMMVALDEADGLVSGAIHTTANTVRPALQLIKTAEHAKVVSSVFFMLLSEQVLVYGDCAINPDPNAEELADIEAKTAGPVVIQ